MIFLRFIAALVLTGAAAAGGAALSTLTDGAWLPSAPTQSATEAPPTPDAAPVVVEPTLEWAAAGDWRIDPDRDVWRNPVRTLRFFDVKNTDTVVEIWPGGGWYSAILGPYLHAGGGELIAAGFDTESSEFARSAMEAYGDVFLAQPDVYGDIRVTAFSPTSDGLGVEGEADFVLTFRNVHNWMAGGWAEKAFADAYRALKPGGVLGVVEHRLPSTAEQHPEAVSGYVQEALVIQFAKEAGFQFDGSSGVNSNPSDTADHPFGVWTLPPVSRSAARGEEPAPDFDRARYDAIGESDRMTLRFVKPSAD